MVRQRTANPFMSVRFRPPPPFPFQNETPYSKKRFPLKVFHRIVENLLRSVREKDISKLKRSDLRGFIVSALIKKLYLSRLSFQIFKWEKFYF